MGNNMVYKSIFYAKNMLFNRNNGVFGRKKAVFCTNFTKKEAFLHVFYTKWTKKEHFMCQKHPFLPLFARFLP